MSAPATQPAKGTPERAAGRSGLRTFGRYCLFQAPGVVVAGAVLFALWWWAGLPTWIALALFAAWIAKELAMFPILRIAYEADSGGGAAALVGARGVAVDRLAPRGYVRLGAELWRAEVRGGGDGVAAGRPVRVRAVDGLTLVCEADDEAEEPPGPPPGPAARAGGPIRP